MKENSTMTALLSNLLIISFIFAFSYPANAASDKPILYFSFDKGSGGTVIDESGNGNDGTLKGNVKWVNDGKILGAVSFDGAVGTYIEVPDNKVLDSLTESITVEAWVKTNKTAGNFKDDEIVGKYANPKPSETWLLFIAVGYAEAQGGPSPNAFGFVASPTSGWDDAAYVVGANKTLPKEGKWYHVAGTFDHKTGTFKIYVNGKQDGERKTKADKIGTNDRPLCIGGNSNMEAGWWWWDGVIDEVAIYNRALTEAEIQKDMTGIASVEPGEKAAATWGSIKRK